MTGSEMVEAILDINPDAEVVILGDNYADIQWGDTAVITLSDLEARKIAMATEYNSQAYSRSRAAEYPSISDQLDDIYHNGIDAWKATIKVTKDKYPK
tara:strand:- start:135 stop:428 length:294 start_codon:yes stop_codon:yes gene_type:complete